MNFQNEIISARKAQQDGNLRTAAFSALLVQAGVYSYTVNAATLATKYTGRKGSRAMVCDVPPGARTRASVTSGSAWISMGLPVAICAFDDLDTKSAWHAALEVDDLRRLAPSREPA